MGLLSAEIANEASPAHVRQSAALALKNQLTAKVNPPLIPYPNRKIRLTLCAGPNATGRISS